MVNFFNSFNNSLVRDNSKGSRPHSCRLLLAFAILGVYVFPALAQDEVFQQEVTLSRQNSSIYSVFNQISAQTGYYFVYDTEVLNSDKRTRLRQGRKTLELWLYEIVDDPGISYRIIENHILLYRSGKEAKEQAADKPDEQIPESFTIEARVLDESSRDPLAYATVGIKGRALGITTNSDGVFKLEISGEYQEEQLSVSHLGYRSQDLPIQLFMDNRLDILLETDYISIQEVIIRYYDPLVIINAARERVNDNYSNEPVYHLNFYREGVSRGNKFINYSEAFFRVYKSSYSGRMENDQVRLLQSRTIRNIDQTDTLILKIRAGVKSSLDLDFIKNIPDFLDREYMQDYDFLNTDVIPFDGKMAYALDFEQKKQISKPLYKGILYIDIESLAFLGADFEVHPKHIDKAASQFITRKNRNYRGFVDRAAYTVRYKYFDGNYHLNHVRADLNVRYRKRYQIFSNHYHVFVEMVNSRIETGNVSRFDRREVIPTDRVFVDSNYEYDPGFWSGYNIIAPELHVKEALSGIQSKIESVVNKIQTDITENTISD